MTTLEETAVLQREEARRAPLWLRSLKAVWWFTKHKPLGAFGGLVLILTIGLAIVSPWVVPYHYQEQNFADSMQGPSSDHLLGTDQFGTDTFSRILIGSQVTILAGVGTVTLAALLSVVVGSLSGYFGGRFDMIVQRVVDVWVALPPIFLLVTFAAVLGTGGDGFLGLGVGPDFGLNPRDGDEIWYTLFRTTVVITSLGIILAGYGSRVIRGAVLALKESTFIDAARATGAGHARILLQHIFPNIFPIVIILASVNLGVAVLAEATISFLGFGVQPPFPSWGQMLGVEGRTHGRENIWLALSPGTAIFISVYGFNMLGDALRDVLDPRLRGT